jgi:hypothetical protein
MIYYFSRAQTYLLHVLLFWNSEFTHGQFSPPGLKLTCIQGVKCNDSMTLQRAPHNQ